MCRFILPAAMAAVALSYRDHLRACFSSPPAATAAAGDSTTLQPQPVAQQAAIPWSFPTATEQRPHPVNVRPDPSSPPRSTPFWWLPRELRDQILEHAYTPPNPLSVKILHFAKWMDIERRRRDTTANNRAVNPPAIPVCPLTQLLVSRQFYHEAAAAWFRERSLRWDFWDRDLDVVWDGSRDVQKFVVAVEMEWLGYEHSNEGNFRVLRFFKGVRRVRIRVDVSR